jgi:hypothetical protein
LIEKCGGQGYSLGFKSPDSHLEADFPNQEFLRHLFPLAFAEPGRTRFHFYPIKQPILLSERLHELETFGTPGMVGHDAVDAPLGQEIKIGIAAKSGVSQDNVSRFEKVPKIFKESPFGVMQRALYEADDCAGRQGEGYDKFHDREAASQLLSLGLGIDFLIGLCVWHGQTGAVHDFDPAVPP